MYEESFALSILDPFHRPFYEKFGYATAETRVRHQFEPKNIRPISSSAEIANRELDDPKEYQVIQQLQISMVRFGSRAFNVERTLKKMIKESHFHIFEKKSEPVGCIKFAFKQVEKGYHLKVLATAFSSMDVFLSIMELVSQYGVTVNKISWQCDPMFPVRHLILDLWDINSISYGSMMMRVIDFEKYCRAIRIPENVTQHVTLKLSDELCSWNNGVYKLTPSNGIIEIDRVDSKPDVTLNALNLSRIISGLTPATLLLALEELECSQDTAYKLERIFPADSFISYQRF